MAGTSILRSAERGDADAFSTVANAPLLFGLLAFGVTMAALGFGRIGAAAAAERGAYAAGTQPPMVGVAVAANHFRSWSARDIAADRTNSGRVIIVSLSRTMSFGGGGIGRFDALQRGAMAKRVERFYPGGGE